MDWKPLIKDGGWNPALRELASGSGAYAFRDASTHGVLYVGESHTGRMWKTLLRHFQDPTGKFARVNEYTSQTPGRVEAAIVKTKRGQAALNEQARLIGTLKPSHNRDDGMAAAARKGKAAPDVADELRAQWAEDDGREWWENPGKPGQKRGLVTSALDLGAAPVRLGKKKRAEIQALALKLAGPEGIALAKSLETGKPTQAKRARNVRKLRAKGIPLADAKRIAAKATAPKHNPHGVTAGGKRKSPIRRLAERWLESKGTDEATLAVLADELESTGRPFLAGELRETSAAGTAIGSAWIRATVIALYGNPSVPESAYRETGLATARARAASQVRLDAVERGNHLWEATHGGDTIMRSWKGTTNPPAPKSEKKDATRRAALAHYVKTHWGEKGDRETFKDHAVTIPPNHGSLVEIGALERVSYLTIKGGDSDVTEYVHDMGEGAPAKGFRPPILVAHHCDRGTRCPEQGKIALVGGTYRWTTRGIVG